MHNPSGTIRNETQSTAQVIEQKEAECVGRAEPVQAGRDHPRYFDRDYWPEPEEGQTVLQARMEQVAAIEARNRDVKRGTVTISDNSRSHRGLEGRRIRGVASSKEFSNLIPRKPYCADQLSDGLQIRSKAVALTKRHLQLNHPSFWVWLTHDMDRPDAFHAHEKANLPPPNVIMVNPSNGHAHSAYLMAAPVARHNFARVEPLRFYAAVERGVGRRLEADRCYSGLIAKNPLHGDWMVEWRRDKPYSLRELESNLFERDMRPDPTPETTFGAGRNVTVFDELRARAYTEVRQFKRDGASFEQWLDRCIRLASALNLQFPRAMKISEVRAIAKSVAKWTWRHFSAESFSARQSTLEKRAMAKRWAGHESAEKRRPWEDLGVSRRTYYRLKQRGRLHRNGLPE